MKTHIITGIISLVVLMTFSSWNSKQNLKTNEIAENRTENINSKMEENNRTLRLVVSYDFGENLKTISEKATPEIIKNTMESINWNEFHIVQLEDENENALHVSGSLYEDGLASGYVTENDHILIVNPPKSVKELTEILIEFLKGEEIWRNKYEYK
ncbi:hypothetical protein [Aequorivita lipolytica]|uniref:Uncharacterized protein n=1 Tax=Aequorivita lipolytica TaxID=153267 RepID=A0A5C6YKF5_9FLAO|nr:hypothetical protein [Aequorivita lipolytica]TXD67818.1 hypothetical protein ESV24_15005 [Aequorivita lipolytica]SRX54027.1 hypothetical protein AEQU2_03045 [Aequorivita lipolytica]